MAAGPSKEWIASTARKVRKAARLKFPEARDIGYVVQRASNGEACVFATVNGAKYIPWLPFEVPA